MIMLWLFRSLPVLFIYTGIIIYTGFRVFAFGKFLRLPLKAWIFWPVYIILPYSFIVFVIFRLDRIAFVRLTGMYILPFYMYLFAFILLFDLVSLAVFIFRRIVRPTYRRRINIMPAGTGAAVILTLLLLLYGSFHAQTIKTVYYELAIPGKANLSKLRIALVSDLHIGPTVGKKWTGRIVDRINGAEPDLVCIAGDIFDSGLDGITDKNGIAAELGRLQAPLGVYACPGNHDANRRTRSLDDIDRFLSEVGIKLLCDEVFPLPLSDAGIYVAGRRDARPISMQSGRLSIQELTAPIAESMVILLDHQPVELPQAADAGIDLVLCGHTHRGQFFPGNLITSLIYKKAGGTHYGCWKKNNTQAIVSSGAGLWGPPIRIGTNSEVAVIDLRF